MTLQASTLESLLIGQFTSNQIKGERMPDLAKAIANAVIPFFTSSGKVVAVAAGLLGSGTGSAFGVPGFQGTLVEASLLGQFAGQGIKGQYMPSMAKAIGQSVGTIVSASAQATGISIAGVGTGAGTLTLVGFVPTVLVGKLASQFSSVGFQGAYVTALANAIGNGIGSLVNGQQMVLTVSGSGSMIPSSGSGTGSLS